MPYIGLGMHFLLTPASGRVSCFRKASHSGVSSGWSFMGTGPSSSCNGIKATGDGGVRTTGGGGARTIGGGLRTTGGGSARIGGDGVVLMGDVMGITGVTGDL